ncbi:LppX_LprAFG lipoprotein [Streptomyces sp. NPDC002580]|uniref:LppX_LprAFG lipoprotein n=1 Tax=Streptomyces sp. NPDC002580 TaxID=3364653 RepID=UPI0036A8768A
MRRPLLLVAVTTLVCTGCSTADTESDAKPAKSSSAQQRSVVRAAVATVRRDTARIVEKIEIVGDGSTYKLAVTGGFDFAGDRGRIAVDFPEGGISHGEEVFAGGKIYINSVHGITKGKWGVMPRDEAEAHYALRAPLNDPEHVLKQLSAMREVSREGEESVHGVRTVHYRGMLDHDALTLRMAQDMRKKMDQARAMVGSDLPAFADAWVDGKGALAQARIRLDLSSGSVTVTLVLTDFGKPVRVKVPKAEETVPVTSATGVLNG